MTIPESQLETLSNQGAVTIAKLTADSIKNAINSFRNWSTTIDYDVYLQGSYKNDTNIRGDSDVDVVAQLNTTFYNNLSEEQQKQLGFISSTYNWTNFRNDVLQALKEYYGQNHIIEGNKSIKITPDSGRLPADVVVSCQYRKYKTVSISDYVEGITFWSKNNLNQIINYPKIHFQNGVSKNQNSNNWYKRTVRLFKNCRNNSHQTVPSYFLECLLYNVPNSFFGVSFQYTYNNIINYLNKANLNNFICQNCQEMLFGPSQEQWNIDDAKNFIAYLNVLWNN